MSLIQEAPGGLFAKCWEKWQAWLRKNVIVRTILVCGGLVSFVFLAVFWQIRTLNAEALSNTRMQAVVDNYNTDLRVYDNQLGLRAACLSRVDGRNILRDVLGDFADGFTRTLPNEPLAAQYAHDRHAYIDAHYPAIDPTTCGPMPTPPPLPKELQP